MQDLDSGRDALESRARSELGLIKPCEVFYQVVDPGVQKGDDGKR